MRLLIALSAFALLSAIVLSYESGPEPGHTGAPDELTCTSVGCHTTYRLNPDANGRVALEGVPARYATGERYTFKLSVSHPTARRWGFQITALDAGGNRAGAFVVTDAARTQVVEGGPGGNREYVEHTLDGTAAGQADGHGWTFDWIAPAAGAGDVAFYAAGSAGNNNGKSTGDRIYTRSPEPIAVAKAPQPPES